MWFSIRTCILVVLTLSLTGCVSADEWCKQLGGELYFSGDERNDIRSGCAIGPKGQCGYYTYYVHQWKMSCYLPDGTIKNKWYDEKVTNELPPYNNTA